MRTFKDIFEGKWPMLQEKLDTEHGLLDELETNKVITSQHRTAVEVMHILLTTVIKLYIVLFSLINDYQIRIMAQMSFKCHYG